MRVEVLLCTSLFSNCLPLARLFEDLFSLFNMTFLLYGRLRCSSTPGFFEQIATGEAVRGPLFISSLALRLVFYHHMSGSFLRLIKQSQFLLCNFSCIAIHLLQNSEPSRQIYGRECPYFSSDAAAVFFEIVWS